MKLDDSLAEAHTSRLNALVLNLQFSDAAPEFQRAIELNPNYATAHHWYGELLQNDGRIDEALAELRRAHELDPLSLVINSVLGSTLIVAGQDDAAIDQLQKTIAMDPNFIWLTGFWARPTRIRAGWPKRSRNMRKPCS